MDDPLLQAADILDLANYPSNTGDLLVYGYAHVSMLVNHFHDILIANDCNTECIEQEWDQLKYDIMRHHRGEPFQAIWNKMLTEKQDSFPNVLHLVRILLVTQLLQLT